MQTNSKSKQQKLVMLAVIFGIPLAVVAFVAWNFAHKKPTKKEVQTRSAFNTGMPTPNLPKAAKSKLDFYKQAQEDSLKQLHQWLKDPYAQQLTGERPPVSATSGEKSLMLSTSGTPPASGMIVPEDPAEKKVKEKLAKIYAAINTVSDSTHVLSTGRATRSLAATTLDPSPFDHLVAALQKRDTAPDPQMQQINQALDKILTIQHPDKKADPPAISRSSSPGVTVKAADATDTYDAGDGIGVSTSENHFWGLSEDVSIADRAPASIRAVIHETQTIQSGSIVKLRLLQDILVGDTRIPANNFVFGEASITNERVNIRLTNVVYNDQVYPISLRVFDGVDGLEGLYVPGAITRDVVKDGMSQGISGVGLTSLDPSIGAQATVAGIETAKALLSRKIKLVKVALKTGHLAILKADNNR